MTPGRPCHFSSDLKHPSTLHRPGQPLYNDTRRRRGTGAGLRQQKRSRLANERRAPLSTAEPGAGAKHDRRWSVESGCGGEREGRGRGATFQGRGRRNAAGTSVRTKPDSWKNIKKRKAAGDRDERREDSVMGPFPRAPR